MNVQEQFDLQRNKLLNDALFWLSIVSIPSVALSWARSLIIGWQPLSLLFTLLLAILWILWLSRNRTSYSLRISGMLSIAWVVTYAGLLNLGPIAYSGLYVIYFSFIAILFLKPRTAAGLIVGNTLCLAMFAVAASRHWIEFNDINYPAFSHHPLAWTMAVWAFSSHAIILALIGWRMMNQLLASQNLSQNLADRERLIISSVPGVIYQLQCGRDRGVSVDYISGAVERILGCDPEAFLADGGLLFSVMHPEDAGRFQELIGGSGRDFKPFNESFRILHPRQGLIWAEMNATPEPMANSGILWHGYIRDITPLKQAENRLSASLENTPNVAVQWFDSLGRVVYWNHASELMYGWRASEALGKPLAGLIQTGAGEQNLAQYFHKLDGEEKTLGPFENSAWRRDGRQMTIFQTLFQLPDEDKPLFVSMCVDITELKQTQLALEGAKSEAEQANKAKSEFLTHMSHELRTPLNAIIGFAQLLDMERLAPPGNDQKQAAGHILASGRHLLNLINEILDLARIETGKLMLQPETIDLIPLIRESVVLSVPAASKRHVDIRFTFDGELYVDIDPSRIRQVLLNLISNAIKYNRDGGGVTIFCEAREGWIRVSVADTGMGLSDRQQSAIFQPFQRLGAERSNMEGTGIGLALCKNLMEAMRGRIGFDSTPGVGSNFWIELPQADAGNRQPIVRKIKVSQATANHQPTSEKCVVYIEDSPVNCALMQGIFEELPDIRLIIVGDAENGLPLIRDLRPDLVLMDINLPGLSGLEALHILKADPETAFLPIIAVSAAAMPENIESGLNAGFAAYLTKPFDVAKVIALVRENLQSATGSF